MPRIQTNPSMTVAVYAALLKELFMAGCCTGPVAVATSIVPAVHVKISSRFSVPNYLCVYGLKCHISQLLFLNLPDGCHTSTLRMLHMLVCTLCHTGMTLHICAFFTFMLCF